jgi:polysaccharide biosynthesis protein PslH
MSPKGSNILCISQMPASRPRSGAQLRIHGLMTQLARRHNPAAAMLVDDECHRAMQAYWREVILVPNPLGREGFAKRLRQVRSLVSIRSRERLRVTGPFRYRNRMSR